jgi:hypothetical protein
VDLLPVAHAGWVAFKPAEVIGVALRQLSNGEACVVPEVEAGRIEGRALGGAETWPNRLAAALGNLDRFELVRTVFHWVTIVRPAGALPQRDSCTILGPMYWPVADPAGLDKRAG